MSVYFDAVCEVVSLSWSEDLDSIDSSDQVSAEPRLSESSVSVDEEFNCPIISIFLQASIQGCLPGRSSPCRRGVDWQSSEAIRRQETAYRPKREGNCSMISLSVGWASRCLAQSQNLSQSVLRPLWSQLGTSPNST